jgi:hypothetical protein
MGLLDTTCGADSYQVSNFMDFEPDTREFKRVAGFFHVEMLINGKNYKSITHNICYSGMFIETGQAFLTGQEISIVVRLSALGFNFQVDGVIVRNSPHGIGVKLIRN